MRTAISSCFARFATTCNDVQHRCLQAPDAARFALQTIDRSVTPAAGHFLYFDADLHVIADVARPEYPATFDPRTRPWYRQAIEQKRLIRTAPYVFSSVREVGATLAFAALVADNVALALEAVHFVADYLGLEAKFGW